MTEYVQLELCVGQKIISWGFPKPSSRLFFKPNFTYPILNVRITPDYKIIFNCFEIEQSHATLVI